jgi:hypothetical protein
MHTGSGSGSSSSSKEDACAARLQAIAEEAHTHWLTTSAHRALSTAATTAAGTTAAGAVNRHSTVSAAQSVAADTNSNTAEVAAHSSSSSTSSSSSRASSNSNGHSHIGINGNGNGNSVQLYSRQRSPVITQFKLLLARSWRQVQSVNNAGNAAYFMMLLLYC